MNTLANFVHSKIDDSCNEFDKALSYLESAAWRDLQALLNRPPQDVAQALTGRPSPAEWPVANYPITASD